MKGRGQPKKNPQPKGRKDNIMKAAKYVMFTDHLAERNNEDRYTRLDATDIFEAMSEVINRTAEDEHLYQVTVYELCKNTAGKYYKAILRQPYNVNGYHHAGFFPCKDEKFMLMRYSYGDKELFNLIAK